MPETDKLFPRLREPKCFVDRPVPSELSAALELLAGLLGEIVQGFHCIDPKEADPPVMETCGYCDRCIGGRPDLCTEAYPILSEPCGECDICRARAALDKLGWTPPVCPTCGGSKEVRWRDAIVEDGQPFEVERRDLCPDCTPNTERGK